MTETIISPDEVDVDGKYIRIGADVTFPDAHGELVIADPTVIPADPEDPCDKKTVRTRMKSGYAGTDAEFPLGEQTQEGDQCLYAPIAMCVSNTLGRDKEWIDIQALIDGIPLDDELGLTNCFGEFGDIRFQSTNSGSIAWHHIRHKVYELYGEEYEYVGFRNRVGKASDFDKIKSDERYGSYGVYLDMVEGKDEFVEWSYMEELKGGDFVHQYTTIGGSLGADLTLTAGTYDNTGITHGTYDVYTDSSSGEIWVRTRKGAQCANQNSTGSIKVTDATNTVYWTSQEDWVSGGSGHEGGEDTGKTTTPGTTDYSQIADVTNNGYVTLQNFEVWYCSNPFYMALAGAETGYISITDGLVDNCAGSWTMLLNTLSSVAPTITIDNVKFGSGVAATTATIYTQQSGDQTINITDSQLGATEVSTREGVFFGQTGTVTINIKRTLVAFQGTATVGDFYFLPGASVTMTIDNSVFDGNGGGTGLRDRGLHISPTTGTVSVTINNTNFTNYSGTGDAAIRVDNTGSPTLTCNTCRFFNNTTDIENASSGSPSITNTSPLSDDPAYANIESGAVISTNMDDGWCSGSTENGTGTLGALATNCTPDGFEYNSATTQTVGMLYKVSAFAGGGGGGGVVVPIMQIFQSTNTGL